MTRPLAPADVRLTQKRPVDGKPNPYRTRWFEHEGVVIEVASDELDGLWRIAPDDALLWRVPPDYYGSDVYHVGYAVRLSDARTLIAALINSPEWPAIRDAYVALRADLNGDQP